MLKLILASALAISATASTAADPATPAYMPGDWSLGDTENCPAGWLPAPAARAAH